jgi:DNA-binding winged helix-turn-helix (wHTH) protein
VQKAAENAQVVRFATFEVDLSSEELRKGGVKLKLSGQPFQVLAILLERPGKVVTREELQKRLWPDTFVDVTLPRRGYRFIAPLDNAENGVKPATITSTDTAAPKDVRRANLIAGWYEGCLSCYPRRKLRAVFRGRPKRRVGEVAGEWATRQRTRGSWSQW